MIDWFLYTLSRCGKPIEKKKKRKKEKITIGSKDAPLKKQGFAYGRNRSQPVRCG